MKIDAENNTQSVSHVKLQSEWKALKCKPSVQLYCSVRTQTLSLEQIVIMSHVMTIHSRKRSGYETICYISLYKWSKQCWLSPLNVAIV